MSCSPESRDRIEETLGMLFSIGKDCYEEFVMSVSNYHKDLTEGSAAYLEADTAFDNVSFRITIKSSVLRMWPLGIR